MSEMREMFTESAMRIFRDHCDQGQRPLWHEALWNAIDENGFTRALVNEEAGGSGLSWADAFAVLAVAGQYAAPVPLAEAMIANWLLGRAGVDAPDGVLGLAPANVVDAPALTRSASGWTLDGTLHRLPWGRFCAHLVVVCDGASAGAPPLLAIIACNANGVRIEGGANLAGEARDSFMLRDVVPLTVVESPLHRIDCCAIAAVARSALMAGALETILALSIEYANLREQFGRPIAKFQAIQHNLAVLATQNVMATTAAQSAAEELDTLLANHTLAGTAPRLASSLAIMSAKICAGEAAGAGAALAHQAFGAIGFTEEHSLHLYTKRLWSWRDEFGNEAWWSKHLGERMIAAGKDALWPALTDTAEFAADNPE